jgi:AhpC/TSA family protein
MSSSATTESPGAGDAPHRTTRPRRLPILLGVAALLAVLLIVAGVLALLGQGSPSTTGPPANALVGVRLNARTFPRETLLNGHGRLVAPWVGHRGAVLLFFADWCTVCHGEVHRLAHLLGAGDVGGVRVVGYDGDVGASVAAGFVASNHIEFPVAHDKYLAIADTLVPAGLPGAVFVGAGGKITAVDYGALSVLQLDAGLSTIRR